MRPNSLVLCTILAALACGQDSTSDAPADRSFIVTVRTQAEIDALPSVFEGVLSVEPRRVTDLEFTELAEIHGGLRIAEAGNLVVAFPRLKLVNGSAGFDRLVQTTVEFAALEEVRGAVQISESSALSVVAPLLETMTGRLEIIASDFSNCSFAKLRHIGGSGLILEAVAGLKLEAPQLARLERIHLSAFGPDLQLPAFQRVDEIRLDGGGRSPLTFWVKEVSSISISVLVYGPIHFPELETIDVLNLEVGLQAEFPKLREAKSISLVGYGEAPATPGRRSLPALEHVDLLAMRGVGLPRTISAVSIGRLDVQDWRSGINFERLASLDSLLVAGANQVSFPVLGEAGDLEVQEYTGSLPHYVVFPVLERAANVTFPGVGAPTLASVDGDLVVDTSALVDLGTLTRVGNDLLVTARNQNVFLPELSEVGGDVTLVGENGSVAIFEVPSVPGTVSLEGGCHFLGRLEGIDGDLRLGNSRCDEIAYPDLRHIGGVLRLENDVAILPPLSLRNLVGLGYTCDAFSCSLARSSSDACSPAVVSRSAGLTSMSFPRLEHVVGSIKVPLYCSRVDLGSYVPSKACGAACIP